MDIKPYLKYYIGCDIWEVGNNIGKFYALGMLGGDDNMRALVDCSSNDSYWTTRDNLKPILRRLEDMTEDDKKEVGFDTYQILRLELNHKGVPTGEIDYQWSAKQMHYLISRGYWLFGEWAWEKGLIIDKKTINT